MTGGMKRLIDTDHAPAAIGPYSQAVLVGGLEEMLFCSGQVGLDPATKSLVDGGVEAQTRCALANLRAVLGAAQMTPANVVRCTIYLTNMKDFEKVNALYAEFFEGPPPARVTIGVAALPAGAAVEIDAIATR